MRLCRSFISLLVLALLPLLTGCWVQSVYPFYQESDVVVDPALVGTWAGEAELKSCLLKVSLDSQSQVYTVEISNSQPGSAKKDSDVQCDPAKLEGKMAQFGPQRFLDITIDPDKFWPANLDTVFKVEIEKQRLTLTPLDAEWMSNALSNSGVRLEGRVQESGGLLPIVAVTLISPTSDLRDFLLHSDLKSAFSESDRMSFSRKQ